MRRVATTTLFCLLALICLAVALFSARFLLPSPVMAEGMAPHLQARPVVFLVHVAGGVTALALGAFQLVTWRGPRRWWHRTAGRVYVVACLIGAVAGLGLAATSPSGPVAGAGFGLLALAWFSTTALAWRKAVTGDFAQHRRWMIRSLALTFAAVTLRIMIPLSMINGVDFAVAYPAIAFLCWIPNLIVAELWLRLWGWTTTPPAPLARTL
jgi:uncharacterized membrane protein